MCLRRPIRRYRGVQGSTKDSIERLACTFIIDTIFFFEFARPLGGMLENNRGSFDCDLARRSHASFAHSDDRRAPQRARDARIQCITTRTHSCEGRPRPKRARIHGVRRAGERYGASVAADHIASHAGRRGQ